MRNDSSGVQIVTTEVWLFGAARDHTQHRCGLSHQNRCTCSTSSRLTTSPDFELITLTRHGIVDCRLHACTLHVHVEWNGLLDAISA